MTSLVRISPVGPVHGSIRPPGSKSITNRALVCAALAKGKSTLRGALDSEDTQVMLAAWRSVGVPIELLAEGELVVDGCAGQLHHSDQELSIGNSGTTIRFLTAALSACRNSQPGNIRLDGVARMRQRPIGDLLAALAPLGAKVSSSNNENPSCPPVELTPGGLLGGATSVRGDISSQFLSGLMMASPLANEPVEIQIEGKLVSEPYVQMTAEVMNSFGAEVTGDTTSQFAIKNTGYQACEYAIEPDASAASYFWAAAAITHGTSTVQGLSQNSLQGDVGFCDVLRQMGCSIDYADDSITVSHSGALRGIDVDMGEISDTVQTLAAVALFAEGPTRVRNVAHNRVKETDRISDLATELKKLGARVNEYEDGLEIHPPSQITPAQIATYHDHRMAMSLALVGLRCQGIQIEDPACTGKTYPNYWEDLAGFTGSRIC